MEPPTNNDPAFSDNAAIAPDAPGGNNWQALANFNWIEQKFFPAVGKGVAIVAVLAAGLLGTYATLAAGGLMLAVELGRAFFRNRADQRRELALYHDDVARVLGKSPGEAITIEDMHKAADEKQVGDKALKPLKMELEHLQSRARYNYVMGAARAVITTLGAFAMGGMTAQAGQLIQAGEWAKIGGSLYYPILGSLAAIGMATYGAETIVKNHFHAHMPPSSYKDLSRLQESLKERPVEPERVFGLTVKLDKALADDIRARAGKPYQQLTHNNKLAIVKAYEHRAHAATLAQLLNDGAVNATAVALNASGQLDWNDPARAAATPAPPKEAPAPAKTRDFASVEKRIAAYSATYQEEKAALSIRER